MCICAVTGGHSAIPAATESKTAVFPRQSHFLSICNLKTNICSNVLDSIHHSLSQKNPGQRVIICCSTHGSLHCSISRHSKSNRLAVSSMHSSRFCWLLSLCRKAMRDSEATPASETGCHQQVVRHHKSSWAAFVRRKKHAYPHRAPNPLSWAPSVAYSQENQL